MATGEDELRALMAGGLDGDAASYAVLLRALVPLLRAYYRRRLGADGEVEDLVQETLIAVHARRASYDRARPFTAWLYAIARYKLVDHHRRGAGTVPLEDWEAGLSDDGFEDASGAAIDVERLLGTLAPKQADAIRRTRLEGLSSAEAARAGGIGEADVKVSVHRGLKLLMARLRGGRP